MPLFFLNKNISRAARELFYTMKSFFIHLGTGGRDTWEHQTFPALRQLGSFNLSLIQRLSFTETIFPKARNGTTIEECISQSLFKEFPDFRPQYFELELVMQDFARTRFSNQSIRSGKQDICFGCACAEQWREQWVFRIIFEEVDEELSTMEFRELSKVSLKKFSCYDKTAHEHVVPPQLAEIAARIHDQLGPSRPMRAYLMRFKQGWGNFNAPGDCGPDCDIGQDSLKAGCSLPLWEREMSLPEDWHLHMDNGIELMFCNAIFDPEAKDPTRAPSVRRLICEDYGMNVYGTPSSYSFLPEESQEFLNERELKYGP
ncbi:MAG: hypothetical protein M1824_002104 [Vezdaea acicularis]|nr:MAG: hypothetical protein M1824_002104 [Vezdaea acicularis]